MTDIERWIDTHENELKALAARADAHDDAVHLIATLVLAGASDTDVYEQLRELVPSSDGRHNPLAHAPGLLQEVRELVEAS